MFVRDRGLDELQDFDSGHRHLDDHAGSGHGGAHRLRAQHQLWDDRTCRPERARPADAAPGNEGLAHLPFPGRGVGRGGLVHQPRSNDHHGPGAEWDGHDRGDGAQRCRGVRRLPDHRTVREVRQRVRRSRLHSRRRRQSRLVVLRSQRRHLRANELRRALDVDQRRQRAERYGQRPPRLDGRADRRGSLRSVCRAESPARGAPRRNGGLRRLRDQRVRRHQAAHARRNGDDRRQRAGGARRLGGVSRQRDRLFEDGRHDRVLGSRQRRLDQDHPNGIDGLGAERRGQHLHR